MCAVVHCHYSEHWIKQGLAEVASFLLVATRGGKILWISLVANEENFDALDCSGENNDVDGNIEKISKAVSVVKVVDTCTPQILGIEVSLALNCAVLSCVTGLRYLKVRKQVVI